MNAARISQLNIAGPLSGGEYIPVSQVNLATGYLKTVFTNPDALREFVFETVADAFCPIGSILTYTASVSAEDVPEGWLLCNGQSVSRSTYTKLFDKIGTTYGSDNTATFKLPNLKGRVVMGYCDASATTSFSGVSGGDWPASATVSLGSIGGSFVHEFTSSELPLKQIKIPIVESAIPPSNLVVENKSIARAILPGTTSSFNIAQPYMVMNYIIKY